MMNALSRVPHVMPPVTQATDSERHHAVSNVEAVPVELTCRGGEPGTHAVEVLSARDVPLGGPRAMTVRRTLPQRKRSLIGAWCFADHYGPGEVNLMTSGHGICHSEVSTPKATILHGVQLWVALPDAHRHTARAFQHYTPPSVDLGGATARVFLGSLAGETSPVRTFTPLLGAEIVLDPHARVTLAVEPTYEHGVLVDTGTVVLAGTELARADLGYLAAGAASLELANPGAEPARVLLLGGTPFDEDIVMWWNFVARSHDEIVAFREAWERESDQFGRIDGYTGTPQRLPAPALPNARIKPRS